MNYLYNLTTIFDYCINNSDKSIALIFPTLQIEFKELLEIQLFRKLPSNTYIFEFASHICGKGADEFIIIVNEELTKRYTLEEVQKHIKNEYSTRLNNLSTGIIRTINII